MPHPGRMTTQKAKDFKGTMRSLLAELGRYRFRLIAVIVFAVLSTIFNIAGPKVLAKATTALATGWVAKLRGTGSIDFGYIGKILLILLAMYLVSAAFSFCQSWIMSGLSQKMCYDFRRQISEKINRLPLAYFEKRTVGEVLSRITNDVDTLGQSLNQSITQLITSITTMIGVLIMMLTISPTMTLIAILILPVSMALVLLVVRFSQKYFRAQQAILGVVNGQVEEVYSGHNVVKAFNREAVVLNDFNAANDKLYESAWKSQFLSGLMMPIMNFVGNLSYVAVAIVGSIFAANGIITIGDIQAFIQYVKNFTQPIQQLSQVSNMLQSMAAAAERVFEFLNEPEEDQQADPARRADPACIDGQVTFDHVRFGYVPEKTIIHDSVHVCLVFRYRHRNIVHGAFGMVALEYLLHLSARLRPILNKGAAQLDDLTINDKYSGNFGIYVLQWLTINDCLDFVILALHDILAEKKPHEGIEMS